MLRLVGLVRILFTFQVFVKFIEASGYPSINVDNGWEWTPLRAAAAHGRSAVIAALLEAGADPNAASSRGSVLMDAVSATRHHPSPEALKSVELLLAAGADVGPQDESPVVLVAESRSPAAD